VITSFDENGAGFFNSHDFARAETTGRAGDVASRIRADIHYDGPEHGGVRAETEYIVAKKRHSCAGVAASGSAQSRQFLSSYA
jgi:hypothetical protein